MQSDKNKLFEKIDELTNTIENLLNRVNMMYQNLDKNPIKQDNKEHLIKDIDLIKNNITKFQEEMRSNINSTFGDIIKKINKLSFKDENKND